MKFDAHFLETKKEREEGNSTDSNCSKTKNASLSPPLLLLLLRVDSTAAAAACIAVRDRDVSSVPPGLSQAPGHRRRR